jgi:PAS domain S-box-containing protein
MQSKKIYQISRRERLILDNMTEIIAYQDRKHRILWANRVAGRSVGRNPKDLVGALCYKLWAEGGSPCKNCPIDKVIKTGKPHKSEIKLPNGRVWSVRGYPIKEGGRVLGVVGITNDLTENKSAERLLKESEEKYRGLSESADVGIVIHDRGLILDANKRFYKMTGYKPNELTGMNAIIQTVSPKSRKYLLKQIKSGNTGPYEVIGIRKNGATFSVEVRDREILYKNRSARLATLLDITERKRSEKALKESEERLSQILRGSNMPMFVIDNQHVIKFWNKACEKLTRLSAKSMIGTKKQWSAFYKSKRPVMADLIVDRASDREVRKHYKGRYKKSVLIEGAYEAEGFFPNLGAKGKWLSFTASPLRDAAGNVVGAIETLQDITEKREAEKRLEDIIMSTADWVWEVDRKGVYTYASGNVKDILGYASEDIIGKTPFDLMPEDEARRVGDIFRDIAAVKKPIVDLENWNITKDGRRVCLLTNGFPVIDKMGELLGYRGVDKDITKQKKAEEAIKKRSKEMERFNKLAVGRELKMIQLKKRIGELEYELRKQGIETGGKE